MTHPLKGFPNRVIYTDFRTRHATLAPKEAHKAMKLVKRPVTEEKKNIAATHAIMDKVNLVGEKLTLGSSSEPVSLVSWEKSVMTGSMTWLPCSKKQLELSMQEESIRSLLVVQRTIRNYMNGKKWL